MKKMIAILLGLILMMSCGITAFAAGSDTLDKDRKQTEIGVYAKYVDNSTTVGGAEVEDGKAEIVLPDGSEVIVDGVEDDTTQVVVYPIPETEAGPTAWIEENTDGKVTDVVPYYIYLVDEEGNISNPDGVTVTVDIPEGVSDPVVYSMDTEGNTSRLDSTEENGKVTFETDGSPYYVVAEKITVPVYGEENRVHVEATIEERAATVTELDHDEIERIVGDEVKTGTVFIELTGLGREITQAKLPAKTIEDIVEAAEQAHNDTESLKVHFTSGSVELDDKALRAVIDQTEGNMIRLVLEDVGTGRLNEKQKAAIKDMKVYEGFEAYLLCTDSNKRISDFMGGVATLSVPFIIPEGLEAGGFTVWHIGDDGSKEELDTWYADGQLHWDVGHFSDFIVVYEEPLDNDNNQTPGSDSENTPAPEDTSTSILSPLTGDGSSLLLWLALLLGSCLILLILKQKKKAK